MFTGPGFEELARKLDTPVMALLSVHELEFYRDGFIDLILRYFYSTLKSLSARLPSTIRYLKHRLDSSHTFRVFFNRYVE